MYEYVLTRDENVLGIRRFSEAEKASAYEQQQGVCPECGKQFAFEEMQGDHVTPWSKG